MQQKEAKTSAHRKRPSADQNTLLKDSDVHKK